MKAILNLLGAALLGLAVVAIWLIALAPPGRASASCVSYPTLVEQLATKWQEAPVHRGLAANGQMVVIFADAEGDTWTAVVLAPDGTACLVASGTGWETLVAAPAGTEG